MKYQLDLQKFSDSWMFDSLIVTRLCEMDIQKIATYKTYISFLFVS